MVLVLAFVVFSENVDRDMGEMFAFDDMFSQEYQPNQFTAKWLGGKSISHRYIFVHKIIP